MNKTGKGKHIKKTIYIGIFTLCVGFFIGGQFENVFFSSLESDFATRELLSQINEEQSNLKITEKKIISLEKDYNKIIKNFTTNEKFSLKKEFDNKRSVTGLTNISGDGLVIKIDSFNNENIANKMESNKIFLKMINDAKRAGAEAISINEQRIINYSDISLAGSLMNINNTPIAPPYEIKIIGNTKELEEYFFEKTNYIYLIEKAFDLEVNLKKVSKIEIPSLNAQKKFSYIL